MTYRKTENKVIKAYLRQLFWKSKERNECLKRDAYTCRKCARKASKAKGRELKVQVDHVKGIDVWDELIELIREKLLCSDKLEDLQTLCVDCHKGKTLMEAHERAVRLRAEKSAAKEL